MKLMYLLIVTIAFSSCVVVYPKKSKDQLGSGECKIFFKQRELAVAGTSVIPQADAALIAGTFVFSGAWMIAENTAGWLEYQGRCDESFLKSQLAKYKSLYSK